MRRLHVTSGDATAEPLRQAGLGGEVAVLVDPLHEGPAPAGVDGEAWCDLRARFIAGAGFTTVDEARRVCGAEEALLRALGDHDEVVLWFEHDLHCQLALVRLLARAAADRPRTDLRLICIGEFPGRPDFRGLGQLTPEELAGLFPQREPVTDAMLELGAAAWRAFRSPDPRDLERLLAGDTGALPYLGPALRRHSQQFPEVGSGLSRTERQALEALLAGIEDPGELYRAVQRAEETVFMTDLGFWFHLRRLAAARRPLARLTAHAGEPFAGRVALTEDGAAVLAGRADAVRLNGIDRWLGGVHLAGPAARWRFDHRRAALVETAA